jgi:hypothetical protein
MRYPASEKLEIIRLTARIDTLKIGRSPWRGFTARGFHLPGLPVSVHRHTFAISEKS